MDENQKENENSELYKMKVEMLTLGERRLLEKGVVDVSISEKGESFNLTLDKYLEFRLIVLDLCPISREDLLKRTDDIISELMKKCGFIVEQRSPSMILLQQLVKMEIEVMGTPEDHCYSVIKQFKTFVDAPIRDI